MSPHKDFLKIPPAKMATLRPEVFKELAGDSTFQQKYWERYNSWIEDLTLCEQPDIYEDKHHPA